MKKGEKTEVMAKERNAYFDNMKALLIFLVVLGHVLSNFAGDDSVGDWIYLVIFSFHMPAFLFVTGYFARSDPKKVIGQLLILYLIFQIAQEVIDYVVMLIKDPEHAFFDFQLFFPMWTLWYLLAMILYNILLPVFDTGDRRKQVRNVIIAFAMGMIISCSVGTDNFLAANRVVTFLPFYLTGYYGKINGTVMDYLSNRKKILSREHMKWKISALVIAGVMMTVLWFTRELWNPEWFFGTYSYVDTSLTPWIKALCYLLAYLWIFVLLIFVPKRRLGYLTRIGQNTLGIYLFHGVALRILREIPAVTELTEKSLLLCFLLAAVLTWLLSFDCVSGLLKKIRIPDSHIAAAKNGT